MSRTTKSTLRAAEAVAEELFRSGATSGEQLEQRLAAITLQVRRECWGSLSTYERLCTLIAHHRRLRARHERRGEQQTVWLHVKQHLSSEPGSSHGGPYISTSRRGMGNILITSAIAEHQLDEYLPTLQVRIGRDDWMAASELLGEVPPWA
jgi:hypothetical protein